MNLKEAIAILIYHQEWRKGADIEQTDVTKLTEALDIAINILKNLKHEEKP